MSRQTWSATWVVLAILAAGSDTRAQDLPRAYVYVPLNVNYPRPGTAKASLAVLRRHVELMQKLGLQADYYFTYLAAKQVMEQDPSAFDAIRKARCGIHHHGANRPPKPQPIDRVAGEDWERDVAAIEEYETRDLDPQTGALRTAPGGLAWMVEKLGLDFYTTGRFFQSSILAVAKKHGADMAVGLASNTGAGSNASWFMGVMIRPDTENVGLGYAAIVAHALDRAPDPTARVAAAIERADPARPLFFGPLIHDHDFYTRDRRPLQPGEIEKVWGAYENALQKLAQRRDVRFVTMADVYHMAVDDRARKFTRAQVQEAARVLAKTHELPLAVPLGGGDWMSLADAFQAFMESLAAPAGERCATADVLGPTKYAAACVREETELSASDIVRAAAAIQIRDRIPAEVSVGGRPLSAAEFLVALARVVTAAADGRVVVPHVEMLPAALANLERSDDPRNARADALTKLQYWTYKPARWNFSEERQ